MVRDAVVKISRTLRRRLNTRTPRYTLNLELIFKRTLTVKVRAVLREWNQFPKVVDGIGVGVTLKEIYVEWGQQDPAETRQDARRLPCTYFS